MLTSLESDIQFAKVTGEILPIAHIAQVETSTKSFLLNKCTMLAKKTVTQIFHHVVSRGVFKELT